MLLGVSSFDLSISKFQWSGDFFAQKQWKFDAQTVHSLVSGLNFGMGRWRGNTQQFQLGSVESVAAAYVETWKKWKKN